MANKKGADNLIGDFNEITQSVLSAGDAILRFRDLQSSLAGAVNEAENVAHAYEDLVDRGRRAIEVTGVAEDAADKAVPKVEALAGALAGLEKAGTVQVQNGTGTLDRVSLEELARKLTPMLKDITRRS